MTHPVLLTYGVIQSNMFAFRPPSKLRKRHSQSM